MTEVKEVERKFLMDLTIGRYDTVKLTKEWLAVLQKSDEAKGLSPSELVKKALDDVSTGLITHESIKKARSKMKSSPAEEEKPKDEDEASSKNEKSKK